MDHALPGAAQFVRRYFEQGAQVVYLTGRDHGMRLGTEEKPTGMWLSVSKSGRYSSQKNHLIKTILNTKSKPFTPFVSLASQCSSLTMSPAMSMPLKVQCPDALTVFIETDHSPRNIVPTKGHPLDSFVLFSTVAWRQLARVWSLPFTNPIE